MRRAKGLEICSWNHCHHHRGIMKIRLGAGQMFCFQNEKKDKILEITAQLACGQTPVEIIEKIMKKGVRAFGKAEGDR